MVPPVGASMPRIMRASVVLPLPDWPTMVNISGAPAWRAKLTSSTRRDAPAREQAGRPNVLETCESSSSGAIMPCLPAVHGKAGDAVIRRVHQSWRASRGGNGPRRADSADETGSPTEAPPGSAGCR